MTLEAIYNQQADYVENSGITIDIDRSFGTVAIDAHGGTGTGVFMQGDEAGQFILEVDAIEANAPLFDRAEEAAAYPYADLLAEI